MNTASVRKYKSNVVMQTIKVIQFFMVCCLKSFYFAILLLPLISAENLNNDISVTNHYRPGKTIPARVPTLDIVTNISHNPITPKADTIITIYNAYFFLCFHHHLWRDFYYIFRNVNKHCIIHDTDYYIQRLNDTSDDENDDKQEDISGKMIPLSWSVEQYWQQKELTLKSKHDNVEVKNQHYCEDIFEIGLCMIFAIFVEIIPLAMHYVCQKTALCWRSLQLYCYSCQRNYTEELLSRHKLPHKCSAANNCVWYVVKLNQINWKRRSDLQQSDFYLLSQKHLTVFAVITGKVFALSFQGATTLSDETYMPAVVENVTVDTLILIPAVPPIVSSASIITKNCKKCCQYFLLKARLMVPESFSTYAQSLTSHGLYILIPQKNRLLPKHLALREIRQLKELDIRWDCMKLYYGGDIKGKLVLFVSSDSVVYRISSELLTQHPKSFAMLRICIQINNSTDGFPAIFKYDYDIADRQNLSETLRIKSAFQDLQTNVQQKSKSNFIKLLKSMKLLKTAPHWNAPVCSTNQNVFKFKCQRRQDNSTNWDDCLNAIIKFDLCSCCWCFYCYRCCNITCGRVMNGCCYGWYCYCPRHRIQCTYKSLHCTYCYYYLHGYYFLNQCHCCRCCTQFRTSLMNPSSCSSNTSNYQLAKFCFNTQNNILPEMQQHTKESKQSLAMQQSQCFRNFFRPHACRTLSELHNCQTIYWFQCTRNCCAHITKPNTMISKMNSVKSSCDDTTSKRKTDFINSIRRRAIYLGKCLYYKLINLADYLCRHIIIVLQVKISLPRSTALVIKVTREQQQQQQQIVNIAHDQQLKMNNLCKIFCNNWKRHRRRRRRRRRRRMNKQEQQQHQSVQLQQQHMNNEKETMLSGVINPRLHILDFNACKAIATNGPVHMLLSKSPTVSMLAAMRLANTKLAMTNENRKDVISPSQTPALITSPTLTATATASTMRLNRNRSRPNLVWLFIGLVWFEGPKYVNCSIHSSSQSPQSSSPAQSQAQATQTTLHPLSTSTLFSQRQHHKIHPPRVTSNLLLLAPNYKQIIKGSTSFTQKAPIREVERDNINGEGIQSGNCLSSFRRASIVAAKRNGKHTRSYDINANVIDARKPYDWLEPEGRTEADFLNEEAHSADSDRVRLESIRRQILTKLGLKHKPNVSHPLPKQFIWDTIYRADGIRSVVSDFDFSENGSHQWELISAEVHAKKPRQANLAKSNGIAKLSLNFPGEQKTEYSNTHGSAAEKVLNVSYKDYLQHVRFEETKILNDTEMPNNFTYLMHISNPKINKDFLREMGFSDIIYADKDDLLEIEPDELKQQVHRGNHVAGDSYAQAENNDGYNLHHREYIMSTDQTTDHNKFEGDDFLGDTQEFITFAEKGKMFKQHRLVEFSPQTNGIPNQKLFVRRAEIHIRIDKVTILRSDNMNRNNHRCGGKKTKPKLWIFQVMEENTTQKCCDNSTQLCVTYDVDITNLGWQKFDVTATVRDWYRRAPTEKLRLLIDCTGCGKHYVLHLFNQPFVNSKQKLYNQRENKYRNDLVVQWTRQRDVKGQIKQTRPKAKHSSVPCNSIFDCNNQNNFTAKVDHYDLNDVRSKLFRHPLLGYTDQSNRLQSPFSGSQNKADVQYSQQQKYMRLKTPASLELSPNRPFLVLHTETKSLRRVRRRAIDCVGAMHGQCCKESFYVSFKALGWDDWIIAPRGYFANYCRGDCTGPFRTPDTFQTFHAHFIEEYRKMGLLNGMQPCCAPVKFSSMSLIYYGDDGIIKRDLPKMVVDECGCP